MVVDVRHDHSLRVPRPDLSDTLGTPNVCASCHAAKGARWALARIRAWTGNAPVGYQEFASTLAAGRRGAADAGTRATLLLANHEQPAIARGTAVAALAGRADTASLAAVGAAVRDPDAWVRLGGVQAAAGAPPERRWELLGEALRDSLRVLRALAGGALAGLPGGQVPPEFRTDLERAQAEYVAGETENADQPWALVNLGSFRLAKGDTAGAERAFRDALAIDPDWIPACANLADLLRLAGRDPEGEAVLRAGLARHPDAPALHHALGLLLIRGQNRDAGLAELARAARLDPDEPRFAYVYAVGLADRGRTREAIAATRRALARHPDDPALAELMHQLGAR
jgi:tetratricopeptide (TPR) repeat protein